MPRRWGRAKDAREHTAEMSTEQLKSNDSLCRTLKNTSSDCEASKSCRYCENGHHCEVNISAKDPLPRPSIPAAAAAFRLHLRALWLRRSGLNQIEVARELQCNPSVLDAAWLSTEAPRAPRQVAKYIAAYEQRMLASNVEPFRAPLLRRGYAGNLSHAYAECASAFPWEQAVLRKRNYETGEVTITSTASSRQDCSFPPGLRTGLPHLDEVLAKMRDDFKIEDPGAYVLCNWYLDGNTSIAPHQHDFWSAILSFGASRIFLLDGQPILLAHGDLLVFGTQRHSVPKMPQVEEGRISVCIFWYPERRKADGVLTITLNPSEAEEALANDALAQAIANKAAARISQMPLDTNGRGVGRLENQPLLDDDSAEEEDHGFLSEDRLLAIALEVSMMEQ
mmetsp:Transcript_120495/g.239827  ORF Transcript_120495/g.239827 Transcript_120495/m.239827 type:complete len:394 (-) Transcript_120495:206-1387(-)|eukprot:CAMPEP_0172719294 /NCGR_PEP_ID=MMETSP1074-20121228/75423_1 /TAXON_ID=2916 /ORGANISM="Ceratium fusus, Strain PA161109" /LENGTH=393 /DNA_ID=CAMNT_0013544633 /DNA_START=57 /DNA_END=1238 /DNA_ORIENTATION=-